MQNFEKPLNEFSEEELNNNVNKWDPRFGALALQELQRRQQEKNSKQISRLTSEIRALKKITDKNLEIASKNSDSSSNLARTAIIIALMSLFAQVVFSIGNETQCRFVSENDEYTEYSGCQRKLDLGLIGTQWYDLPDTKILKNKVN